jgi:hypothetical protein
MLSGSTISGAFDNAASGARILTESGNASFVVSYGNGSPFGDNQLVLSDFQPVPEPSAFALLILGSAAVGMRRRRVRRQFRKESL